MERTRTLATNYNELNEIVPNESFIRKSKERERENSHEKGKRMNNAAGNCTFSILLDRFSKINFPSLIKGELVSFSKTIELLNLYRRINFRVKVRKRKETG